MKSFQSTPDERAADAAAFWAAKIDGASLSPAERAELDAWLRANPRHRVLLSEYCQFSADLEQQLPALVASGAVVMPAPKPESSRRRTWWLASALAAAAAVAVCVWTIRPTHQSETVATSFAQRKSLRLPDGSRIELNARTSVLVDLRANERHVRMADGQAFFTVAKDPSRPFIVETPSGSVRVTGTVFDVQADPASELTVTLVEGSVLVSPGHALAPVALRPHEQLVVTGSSVAVSTLDEAAVENALAWREGFVVFDGTPLAKVLARFARHHGRSITATEASTQLRLTGRYNLDDLDAFLADLESVLPVKVSRDSSGAITVSPRAAN